MGSIPITCFENEYFIYYARVAQLVEHDLAKVGVAGSSPVSRFFLLVRVHEDGTRTRSRLRIFVLLRSAQNRHPLDVVRPVSRSSYIQKVS